MLIELSSQQREGLRVVLEDVLAQGMERNLMIDAAIADSIEQARAFWRMCEMSAKCTLRRRLDQARRFGDRSSAAGLHQRRPMPPSPRIPGARPLPFGHLGDGNIHYNVTQPVGADKVAYLKRWDDVNAVVFAVVKKYGGSISAEHGVGVVKRDLLPSVKDPVALDLMRSLKRMLDPKGILNPGKVL